jgi:hypothetical protein
MIIPWIYQWGLDNLAIRNDWIMILEADQEITPELNEELEQLFSTKPIAEDGFYIQRRQIFRGRPIQFGGYGSKFMLKLFRKRSGALDKQEQDTRVYVQGRVGRLKACIIEDNAKESEILFYLQKHLRYADAFAREEYQRRVEGCRWKLTPRLFGTADQRTLWLKGKYYRLPLYIRPFLYFFYRYDFLQAFWFRLVLDIRLEEIIKANTVKESSNMPRVEEPDASLI